jgi:chlorobactene glucosyltransferase
MLTHLCAALSLAHALRVAGFARSWIEVPLLDGSPGPLPYLSIVVPARNEARSIERCVRSLLAQCWVDFQLIVVDDCSTDETPAILARLAAEDGRLQVVAGKPLPEGWVGKPWALHQGTRAARGSWLLLTDSDSAHAPEGAASALWFALQVRVDALSIATYQELVGLAEQMLLPSILSLILFATGSFGELNDPKRPKRALANGQYMLLSRKALDGLGGFAALRGAIAEDLEFARRLKADGRFRLILAAGESLASVRMYRSLSEIWAGFAKNVFVGARGSLPSLLLGAAYLFATSLGPPVLCARALARGRFPEACEAASATLCTMAAASWAIGRMRHPRRLGICQPVGTSFLAAIVLYATARILGGFGVVWRGRRYSGRFEGET